MIRVQAHHRFDRSYGMIRVIEIGGENRTIVGCGRGYDDHVVIPIDSDIELDVIQSFKKPNRER